MSYTEKEHLPTRVLFERDATSSYPTDSNGCVVCPSTTQRCPSCKSNEECVLRTPTCHQCSTYYCSPINISNRSSTPVGGIVGGVIGGVMLIGLVAAFFYYKYVYRKKHPVLLDDEDIVMNDTKGADGDDNSEYCISNINSHDGDPNLAPLPENIKNSYSVGSFQEKASQRKLNSNAAANRRLSSYESFTRPKTRFNGGKNRRVDNSAGGQRRIKQTQYPYSGPDTSNTSNRNSVATSISTTNASNILPIAYIPGVTVRPTINNTRSIYSYDTESVFSDLNTIENASIIGDLVRANNGQDNKNSTMTAIKAQPRLVNVEKIEEENEDEDLTDDEETKDEDTFSTSQNDAIGVAKFGSNNTTSNLNSSNLSKITINADNDESEDSDVDSDIGEITRATSLRKPNHQPPAQAIPQDREILSDISNQTKQSTDAQKNRIPLDLIELEQPSKPVDNDISSLNGSNNGSFVLDVDIDNKNDKSSHKSDISGERSPFEDPE